MKMAVIASMLIALTCNFYKTVFFILVLIATAFSY